MKVAIRIWIIAVLSASAIGLFIRSSEASWVGANCFVGHVSDAYYKRSEARAYADVARYEGYEWGGGCWNNNNKDDTPYAPDSGGEGPDCSGFTFKSWELKSAAGTSGFTWYNKLENIHGPYSSYDFHSPVSTDPYYRLPNKYRSTTIYMDAFAKNGHVGMLYTDANPSTYTDYIVEAYSDYYGTDLNIRGYRYNSDYVAVRREGWTPECYPYCAIASSTVVALP